MNNFMLATVNIIGVSFSAVMIGGCTPIVMAECAAGWVAGAAIVWLPNWGNR